jgi:hypothetical protein
MWHSPGNWHRNSSSEFRDEFPYPLPPIPNIVYVCVLLWEEQSTQKIEEESPKLN